MKKRCSITKFIIAGLCICLAYVLACCIVLGSCHKKQLLQQGRIYAFSEQALQQDGEGIHFDKERQCMQVTEDEAAIVLNEVKKAKIWNYLFVEVSGSTSSSIPVQIECYNRDKMVFHTVDSQLATGDNYVTLNSSQATKYIVIRLLNGKGMEFSIGEIQLRTKLPASMKKIAWSTLLLSIVFCLLAAILLRSSKIKSVFMAFDVYFFQALKEVLEYIYSEVGIHFYQKIKNTGWYQKRKEVQIFLFTLLFLLQYAALTSGIYAKADYYNYCVLVCCIILLVITVFFIGDRAENKIKNRQSNWVWTAFWLVTCISDMLVDKYYQYTGWVMLIVIGFFLYWWRQMQHPGQLVLNMISGLRIAFLFIAAYSFVYRQSMAGDAVLMGFVFWYCFFQKKKWWDGLGIIFSFYMLYQGVFQDWSKESFAITRSLYDQRLIWSGYMRKLNCFGHQERALFFWGEKWYPNNGILEIVFRYGIFAGVFYLGLLLQSGKMLIDKCSRRYEAKEIRIVSKGIIVLFFVLNLLISLEAPFLSPIWLIFYLFLGRGSIQQENF